MTDLLKRLAREDEGEQMLAYALWVGAVTAIVEPWLIVSAYDRFFNAFLTIQGQFGAWW